MTTSTTSQQPLDSLNSKILATLSDRLGSHYGRQEWELELAAPLWLPGQKASHAALAASTREALRASQQLLRLQLAGELREAWWAVAAARNGEQLAQRRAHTAASLEADVRRRFQAGELARVDANLAQSENLDAQAALATARSERLQAEQVFHTLSGMAAPAGRTAARSGAGSTTMLLMTGCVLSGQHDAVAQPHRSHGDGSEQVGEVLPGGLDRHRSSP